MHRPRKRFGQHFLHEQQIIEQIVGVIAPKETDHIVEIGPGQGAITDFLLHRCGRLTAIEVDRDLARKLEKKHKKEEKFVLIVKDILKVDISELKQSDEKLRLVGNLPYNISTPILFHLLESLDDISDISIMLQREVAERAASAPGNKVYGRLSVMLQTRCQVKHCFNIKPGAFNPPPKVDSSVIQLLPLPIKNDDICLTPFFAQFVRSAFGARRKTLRKALAEYFAPKDWEALPIDSGRRPDTISPEEYVALSRFALESMKRKQTT